jgi:DNA mismatch endonuclease, patch repair protein
MPDLLTPTARSTLMSRIRGADTKPEIIVRSLLHRMGYRFRLHRRDLPGTPDIVLPRPATVVFVHGCFWHRHKNCKGATTSKTRVKFWQSKFATNVERDARNRRDLRRLGWRSVIVWECELHQPDKLERRLARLLLP